MWRTVYIITCVLCHLGYDNILWLVDYHHKIPKEVSEAARGNLRACQVPNFPGEHTLLLFGENLHLLPL